MAKSWRSLGVVASEVLLATAVATGLVALLEGAAPVTGLGGPTASYLLAHRPCRIVVETGGNGAKPG